MKKKLEIILAMKNELYHRKKMEYYQGEIKILKSKNIKEITAKGKKALSNLRNRN